MLSQASTHLKFTINQYGSDAVACLGACGYSRHSHSPTPLQIRSRLVCWETKSTDALPGRYSAQLASCIDLWIYFA